MEYPKRKYKALWGIGLSNSDHCKGEKSHHAKLKDFEVLQIRDLLNSKRFRQYEIGQFYGVGHQAISLISKGENWKTQQTIA